jgi:O-antigen/teichoic acid export membrane protein
MADRVEISKRLIFTNSLAGIALDVANLGVLVWLYRHLLHRISQEEFALYPVVASVTAFLPLLTVVLSSGLGRYALVAYTQGDERRVTRIVSTMFPLHLALGVLILAAGGIFAWYIDRVLTIPAARVGDTRLMTLLTVLSFSVASALAPFQVGFHIRQKIALLNATVLAREIVRIAILFVLVLGVSPRVLWIVVSTVAATVPWLIATTILSRRLVPALAFRRHEFHWPLAGQLTSFGGWMLMGHFAWMLRQAMDPLILNKLAASADVTCFYLGSMPFRRIEAALIPIHQAILPQTTAIHALQDTRRLQNAYLRLSRYCLWASLLAATPLIVFNREVVRLWVGEQFLSAGTVMAAASVHVRHLLRARRHGQHRRGQGPGQEHEHPWAGAAIAQSGRDALSRRRPAPGGRGCRPGHVSRRPVGLPPHRLASRPASGRDQPGSLAARDLPAGRDSGLCRRAGVPGREDVRAPRHARDGGQLRGVRNGGACRRAGDLVPATGGP